MFQQVCLDCNPVKRVIPKRGARGSKNLCGKTVKRANAYEVWSSNPGNPSDPQAWTWYVLKKWQANDDAPYARWFCDVVTPHTYPGCDTGDVYVSDIKSQARRIS